MVRAGRATEGLRADWQQQLAMMKNDLDSKYSRIHGQLTDDTGIYKENKNANIFLKRHAI